MSASRYLLSRCMEACCSRLVLFDPIVMHRRALSSKKQYEPKPAPKRHKDKSKMPEFNVWQGITFGELAKITQLTPKLIYSGFINSDFERLYRGRPDEVIELPEHLARIATLFGFKFRLVPKPKNSAEEQVLMELMREKQMDAKRRPPADPSICVSRPPVVTIMGHVDHGNTTLLDFLRNSQIVKSEFGGITQHIGAFVVKLPGSNDTITFLDTPGHAAFKIMRARGAMVTDIVILVVAADDGVMEQTVESIKFARHANVPIIVAINKCDKSGVDIEKVKHQLLSENLILEEYGGDVQAVKTATVLIHRGTLSKAKFLVAGNAYCCVRAMYDEFGHQVFSATPATPIEVTGWREDELSSAGDEVLEVENEKRARNVVAYRKSKEMDKQAEEDRTEIEEIRAKERELYSKVRLGNIEAELKNLRITKKKKKLPIKSFREEVMKAGKMSDSHIPCFNVVLKGDVHGSIEAILEVCATYNSTKCEFNILHHGIGPVTRNDVELAETFDGNIKGLKVIR